MKLRTKWGIVLILAGFGVIGMDANLPRQALTLDISGAWLLIASSYFVMVVKRWGN